MKITFYNYIFDKNCWFFSLKTLKKANSYIFTHILCFTHNEVLYLAKQEIYKDY